MKIVCSRVTNVPRVAFFEGMFSKKKSYMVTAEWSVVFYYVGEQILNIGQ